MEFLIKDCCTRWVDTGLLCPRCGHQILREEFDDRPTDHFCCERVGCTWTTFYENKMELLEKDKRWVNKEKPELNLDEIYHKNVERMLKNRRKNGKGQNKNRGLSL